MKAVIRLIAEHLLIADVDDENMELEFDLNRKSMQCIVSRQFEDSDGKSPRRLSEMALLLHTS